MTNVECIYCKRKCRRTNKIGFNGWQCDYHGEVQVFYSFPHEPYIISPENQYVVQYYLYYNDKPYEMIFYYNYTSGIVLFTLNKIISMSYNKKLSHTVFHLNFHPEITPENAASKLSTYLLFS